jgi:hypothetical protein
VLWPRLRSGTSAVVVADADRATIELGGPNPG